MHGLGSGGVLALEDLEVPENTVDVKALRSALAGKLDSCFRAETSLDKRCEDIRRMYRVDLGLLVDQLLDKRQYEVTSSEGKSGAIFVTTRQFIIKQLKPDEHRTLEAAIERIWKYVRLYPATLLAKPLAVISDGRAPFLVMINCFQGQAEGQRQYDLKGSTVGRSSTGCPGRCLKDNDIQEGVRLSAAMRGWLLR